MKKIMILAVFFICSMQAHPIDTKGNVDLVVFSYDRPLQLYAFLESTERYITGCATIKIIYRTSSSAFDESYKKVQDRFKYVVFLKQGINPSDDFKRLTLQATFDTPAPYILYAVDDIIVKDEIKLDDMVAHLKKNNAYGFYLRLGNHVDYCYMLNIKTGVPALESVGNGVYRWRFDKAFDKPTSSDWTYPNSVDMTLYKKKDIEGIVRSLSFNSPNTFEGRWASGMSRVSNRFGLCYESSKIINIPVNLVQNDCTHNRNMNAYSTKELLDFFNEGKKIDIAPFYQVRNNSPHMEYNLTFVSRGELNV